MFRVFSAALLCFSRAFLGLRGCKHSLVFPVVFPWCLPKHQGMEDRGRLLRRSLFVSTAGSLNAVSETDLIKHYDDVHSSLKNTMAVPRPKAAFGVEQGAIFPTDGLASLLKSSSDPVHSSL